MTLYRCFRLRKRAAPRLLYSLGKRLRPQVVCSDWFRFEARTGEKLNLCRMAILVALGRTFGLRRRSGNSPGAYEYEVVRNYDDSDFAACELLLLCGHATKYQIQHDRDPRGRLLLSSNFVRGLQLGNAWSRIVVSDEVRRSLEKARLIGLRLQEAVPRDNNAKAGGPFWEVQSSLVLPKMANIHQLKYIGMRGAAPEPFDGDYSRMVFLDEPPYRQGEIHYRKSDLDPLGQFDIANTLELYRQPHSELVISQRFYRTCRTQGIDLRLEPVRIDP